ncbi:Zn(II)2Cys6 transcription factor domain-containing protein [Aspergillus homomorphus CBS 101889]|uniref:Zn(2)-C6 fungal-type domain-containing protein n=1 Tax=Aspergillus homomorphus (strain CBS 101889) TaxID=1450537 RepID=A0A395I5X2_ASPHC|nr:hypothetical protein BO97DRAFT_441174 [Aspergillus homomorphus CBS 101889]RAL15149.1 hypothetical protein BO97DRAFT_441174 [Aspergillus homomorphus CBS 101889]
MNDADIIASTRQKGRIKRSKLGCRTCRSRRIKCDETPGACKKCISTGRQCDGYDLRIVTHKPFYNTGTVIPRVTIPGILAALNSEERRGFGFFQHCTVPALAGFYDSVLWERLSLQIGHADSAVCHASIALSAVHCAVQGSRSESSTTNARAKAKAQIQSQLWQQFAFEQLGRSFKQLQKRHTSQDPQFTVTVLVCCLLFVALEFTLEHYENAFQHLCSGLQILENQQIRVARGLEPPLEPCLVETFTHLDIQAAFFDVQGRPILSIDDTTLDHTYVTKHQQGGCWTIAGIRRAIEPLAGAVVWFCRRRVTTGYDQSAISDQTRILERVLRFLQFLDSLSHRPGRTLTIKERRCLKLLQLEAYGLKNALLTISLPTRHPRFHDFRDDFETVLFLATEIQCQGSSDLPPICLDLGVVPQLYTIAKRAIDDRQRWQAVRLLQSYPHQEGPWNAHLLARIAIESIYLESLFAEKRAEDATGAVVVTGQSQSNGSLPGFGGFVTISPDQRRARISFRVQGVEKECSFNLDDTCPGTVTAGTSRNGPQQGWHRVLPSHLQL